MDMVQSSVARLQIRTFYGTKRSACSVVWYNVALNIKNKNQMFFVWFHHLWLTDAGVRAPSLYLHLNAFGRQFFPK